MFSLLKYFTLSINLYETPNNYNKKSLSSLITTENQLKKSTAKILKTSPQKNFLPPFYPFFTSQPPTL